MKKTIGLVLSAGVVVAMLAVFLAGAALAQTPAPSTPVAPAAPSTPAAPAAPSGKYAPGGGNAALLTLLGMTPQEYLAARQGGKTLSDIGKDKGVTDQQIIDALTSARNAAVDKAVTDGKLTQPQADWLKQMFTTLAQLQLTNPFVPGQGRTAMLGGWGPMGQGMGPGMMGRGFMGRGFEGNRGRFNDRGNYRGFGQNFRNGERGFPGFEGMPWGRGPRGNNQNQPNATPAPSTTPSASSSGA